jgi:hypothetical protein
LVARPTDRVHRMTGAATRTVTAHPVPGVEPGDLIGFSGVLTPEVIAAMTGI